MSCWRRQQQPLLEMSGQSRSAVQEHKYEPAGASLTPTNFQYQGSELSSASCFPPPMLPSTCTCCTGTGGHRVSGLHHQRRLGPSSRTGCARGKATVPVHCIQSQNQSFYRQVSFFDVVIDVFLHVTFTTQASSQQQVTVCI